MGKCWSAFRAKFTPNEPTDETALEPVHSITPLPDPAPSTTDGGAAASEIVKINTVDLCLVDNGKLHHTDKYYLMTNKNSQRLIVRRGQPFTVALSLSRSYNEVKDAISFVFTAADAEKPSMGQATLIVVPLLPQEEALVEGWNARVESSNDSTLKVQIIPPATTIIGPWKMEIDSKFKSGDKSENYRHLDTFYIIFNPWCLEDQVYMQEDSWKNEFVLNDTGLIWRGSHNLPRPCVWNFAQFEEDILECSLYLLSHVGHVRVCSRSDPVKIVRAISAAVNSPDDDGALVGRWDNKYGGGTSPTEWAGSMKILQQFYKKKKSVKYGQCWVFAGVVTTICRSLGIPSRPVTNFASAHDTQNSLTIDYFVDEEGEMVDHINTDSIWNFHVWNEAWMQRPDLEPGGYSGWQAIDSTPQEQSDDMYRCGPASVAAIRRAEILRPFDGTFVFAEVNADKLFWRYHGPSQPFKLLAKKDDAIGMNISTKAVGSFMREDVTLDYKYAEKSSEEREAMLRALRQSESLFSRYYLNERFNDIRFDFELRDDIVIGSPFNVLLTVMNVSDEKSYTVSILFRVDTVLYTGKVKDLIKKEKMERTIAPGAVEEFKMEVSYDDYYWKLADQCAFNIACLASVNETNFEYFAQDDFRVRKPDIKIEVEGDLIAGQEFVATASFRNPLPLPLKKGTFFIEGPGLGSPLKIKINTVEAKGEAKTTFKLTPKIEGEKTIAAKFNSKQLEDVDGFLSIVVLPKKEQNGTGNSA